MDVPADISVTPEVDSLELRRRQQCLVTFGLRRSEMLPQHLAGLDFPLRIGQRADNVAHQRRIILAHPDLESCNALLLQSAAIQAERFDLSGGQDHNSPRFPEI